MMWYWGGGAHWWAMLIGFFVMIAFWGLLIWAVWYFVAGSRQESAKTQSGTDPKGILDERLARGEIDAEEYGRLRDLIGTGSGRAATGSSSAQGGSGS